MKILKIILITFFVLFAITVLVGCSRQDLINYVENWGYIEDGFSEDLNELLYNDYQISIPENAVFIEGRYLDTLQATTLHIYFKVPCDASMENEILGDKWKDPPTAMAISPAISLDSSISFPNAYKYGDCEFPRETYIKFSEIINGEQYYYFSGYNPSEIVVPLFYEVEPLPINRD